VAYSALETIEDSPLFSVLAALLKHVSHLESQVSRLDSHNILSAGETIATSSSQSTSKEKKRALLIGDGSVKKSRGPLKDILPKSAQLKVVHLTGKTAQEMTAQAMKQIELKREFVHGVFFHPGVEDCLQLNGEAVIAAVKDFSDWLQQNAPATKLTVYSVPVLHEECKKVNTALQSLSETGLLVFVPLTKIQSNLLVKGVTSYDDETARNVASVAARHVSSFLELPHKRGDKVKVTDPSKPKFKPKSKQTNKGKECQTPPEMPRVLDFIEEAFRRFSKRQCLLQPSASEKKTKRKSSTTPPERRGARSGQAGGRH